MEETVFSDGSRLIRFNDLRQAVNYYSEQAEIFKQKCKEKRLEQFKSCFKTQDGDYFPCFMLIFVTVLLLLFTWFALSYLNVFKGFFVPRWLKVAIVTVILPLLVFLFYWGCYCSSEPILGKPFSNPIDIRDRLQKRLKALENDQRGSAEVPREYLLFERQNTSELPDPFFIENDIEEKFDKTCQDMLSNGHTVKYLTTIGPTVNAGSGFQRVPRVQRNSPSNSNSNSCSQSAPNESDEHQNENPTMTISKIIVGGISLLRMFLGS